MTRLEMIETLCHVISEQSEIISFQNELIEQSDAVEQETKDALRTRIDALEIIN